MGTGWCPTSARVCKCRARKGPNSPAYIIEVYLGKGDPILSHTHEHGPAPQAQTPQAIPGVQSIIAVGSGKGGVGKTTLSVNLAIALARMGHKVGLLDADVYGPNVPLMFGTNEAPQIAAGDRIVPIERYGVRVISVGFLNPGDKPLVWRGPMLHSIIRQFLGQVEWGELDYLVVDLPPGTGDVAISLIQTVPLSGAIVVTTPSDVAFYCCHSGCNLRASRISRKTDVFPGLRTPRPWAGSPSEQYSPQRCCRLFCTMAIR